MEKLVDALFSSEHTEVFWGNLKESETEGGKAGIHDFEIRGKDGTVLCSIHFQQGPVKEAGENGIYAPDLLQIVRAYLSQFQKGDYACRENALAITDIEEAVMWLRKRTEDRRLKNTLGTSAK